MYHYDNALVLFKKCVSVDAYKEVFMKLTKKQQSQLDKLSQDDMAIIDDIEDDVENSGMTHTETKEYYMLIIKHCIKQVNSGYYELSDDEFNNSES